MSVFTATGFHPLTLDSYVKCVRDLQPDAVVALADWTGQVSAQNKRKIRAVERTEEWLVKFLQLLSEGAKGPDTPVVFAPVLPAEYPLQWEYVDMLTELAQEQKISGLAVFEPVIMEELAKHDALTSLPRMSLEAPMTPQEILAQIKLGIDVFATPLFNQISDSGIALSFEFASSSPSPSPSPLLSMGIDMWSPIHKTSLEPLVPGCSCYACTRHHCAFLHHLLQAKEMLGWTLLQIHNHHIAERFFGDIRRVLRDGGVDAFDTATRTFAQRYQDNLPAGTGTRPRVRGYHFKSAVDQKKINPGQWGRYSDTKSNAAPEQSPEVTAMDN